MARKTASANAVIIIVIILFSCFSCERYYKINSIKETRFDNKQPVFYTYAYNKKLNQILEYRLRTGYGIYIESILVNPLKENYKDKYLIKYNVYDTITQTRYETTSLQMFEEILYTKLPSGITLFQYVVSGTFVNDGSLKEIDTVIINACKQKNIKFYYGQDWNYEMWGPPDDDWVNTFYCPHCDTVGWRGI